MICALCFVLFGKPFRKINKGGVVNSINNKNCLVSVDFSVNDSLKDKLVRVLVVDYKKSDDIVKKISEHNPQDVKVICTNSLFKREVNDDTVEVDLLDTKKVIIDNANKYLRDDMSIDKMKGILEELFAQTKKD